MRKGLLLINLGTPDSPEPAAVGRYLREFLMDPFVIDIPKPLRWILVNILIVPRRKFLSAEAYKSIWTDQGSPLALYLHQVVKSAAEELGESWLVTGGMRYGEPSIRAALEKMKREGVDSIVALPLYPQYAESSSRSSIEKLQSELHVMKWQPKLKIIEPFYRDPLHIKAWVEILREARTQSPEAHVLFSYHGLPERHVKKTDPTSSYCLDGGQPTRQESELRKYSCCDKAVSSPCEASQHCYRAHCVATTHAIARELGLKQEQWSLSFQSRLGRTPWIKPYTDEVIPQLAAKGIRSLIVVTPSFVADCLETIEEIGDRAKTLFIEAGGEKFLRVECLNARPTWIKAIAAMAKRATNEI